MDRTGTISFIEDELKGVWPEWSPTEAETRVWFGVLARYDYDTARTAAQQYFSETGGNYKRPKPNGIVTNAKIIIQNRNLGRRIAKDPILTNVFIECLNHQRET